MVNTGILIVGAALIIGFFAVGGIEGVKGFSAGLGEKAKSFLSIPKASAQEIAAAELAGDAPRDGVPIIQTNIAGQRINGGTLTTTIRLADIPPELQTEVAKSISEGTQFVRGGTILLDEPTQKLISTLTGTGTAQFSTGQVGILTQEKIQEIAERELTQQQIADIAALEQRRRESKFSNRKLSGAEVVFQKALQEELSKSLLTSQFGGQTFVGGKLFANPDFFSPAEKLELGIS